MTVDDITKERGAVYGPFIHNATVAQGIKAALRGAYGWDCLPVDVKESLELIALKMSRIATGSYLHLDNWDDIGGYAKIAADRIRNT